jgi:hypothetical protein
MKKVTLIFLIGFLLLFFALATIVFIKAPECRESKTGCGYDCRCNGISISNKCFGPRVAAMIDCVQPTSK